MGTTYALSLLSLVGLPVVQLSSDLLNDAGNVGAAHGGVEADEGTVLYNRRGTVEELGGGSGAALLALLALLGSGHKVLLTVLLAEQLGTLEAGFVDGS